MNPDVEKPANKADIQSLVDRCMSLCSNAEATIEGLSVERQPFLARCLDDTLQQLEVVLQTLDSLDGADEGFTAAKAPQGFIRRLIARTETPRLGDDDDTVRPKFDVSRQGLHGNTWTVSLAEILGFLAFGTKTGVLWVDGPDENFLLGLVEGRLRHVTSDRTPEGLRLGEVLVGYGFMTRTQLERFVSREEEDDGDLAGEILLDTGIISPQELDYALNYQVRQNFSRLLNTRNAIFRFREGLRVKLAHQVDMDINQLILESAQADDEATRDAESNGGTEEDWQSWTSELTAQVTGVIFEDSDAEAETEHDEEEDSSEESPRAKSSSRKDSKAEASADEPEPAIPDELPLDDFEFDEDAEEASSTEETAESKGD